MRLPLAAVLLAGILGAANLPAAAQELPRIDGIKVGGMPHPVSAAIALWDTLDLTEEQIRALRKVQDRTETEFFDLYARQVFDTTALLRYWRPGPVDSMAVLRETRAELEPQVRVMLAMLRARDETFAILSADQRARLDSLVVMPAIAGLFTRPEAVLDSLRAGTAIRGTMRSHPCDRGGSGGSVRLSDRAELIYSIHYEGDSARIVAVVVAQADDELTRAPGPPPQAPQEVRGGGGSVGRWMIQAAEGAVWIDSTRVELNGNNVVLLQGVDRVTRMPDVEGLTSVPSYFHTGACREVDDSEALRAHVLASPEVRAFLERPARSRGPGR